MTATPISNDSDYTKPDMVRNDRSLTETGTDYNNDGVVDSDIVNDDSVNNDIAKDSDNGLPPSGSVLIEDEFDSVAPKEE